MKHDEIRELLPWLLTSTLSEKERCEVEAHLDACADCRQEVKELRELQKAEIELSEEVPPLQSDLLERALREIDALEAQRSKRQESVWSHFASALAAFWNPTPVLVRAVVAAQFVLLLGLSVLFLTRSGGGGIETLGGPGGEVTRHGVEISVQFHAQISEEQLRSTIQAWEGKIVDGPSALGLYTILLPVSKDNEPEVKRILEALRANSEVIAFAERKP